MARKAIYLLCLMLCAASSLSAAGQTQITIAGGWGFYQMDDLNTRYIDNFARPFGLLDDNITNGPNFQADLDYFLSDKITVGIGAEILSGGTDGKVQISMTDETGAFLGVTTVKTELRTTAAAPHVRAQYIYTAGPVNLIGGVGTAYLFGRARLSQNSGSHSYLNRKYTAEGFGLLTNIGILWPVGKRAGVSVMSGYRLYHTDALKEGDDPWVVERGRPLGTINLDFSGPYVMAGLFIKL